MGLDNMLDDREAQAGSTQFAAAGGIHPVEAFEQPLEMFVLNTESLILYVNHNTVILLFGHYKHGLVGVGILDGILSEIK